MVDSVIPIRRLLTRAGYGVALLVMASGLIGCLPEPGPAPEVQIEQIRLPEGYSISVFADSVENARSMDLSPSGTLFVGTRRAGNVYALRDADGDGVADERHVVAEGLQMPNGVAYRDGSLFVAEVSRILRYDDIENRLANPPEPVVVVDDFPSDRHHGWKYIAFGPDDKLYVPVGAPCNVCDRGEPYAAIHRMNADGSDREIFATGVRKRLVLRGIPKQGRCGSRIMDVTTWGMTFRHAN